MVVPPSFGSVVELRRFIASSWYEICGKLCEGHLLAGTHVEEIRKWSSATSYMEKYVAKPEMFPEGVETGRVWGVWNEDLLLVQWETVKVSLKDAYRIRRIYRRLAKMRGRGHLRRLTVFVRHENVVRPCCLKVRLAPQRTRMVIHHRHRLLLRSDLLRCPPRPNSDLPARQKQ